MSILDPSPGQIDHRSAGLADSGESFPTRRRGEESPGDPRRRCSRDGPEPFDREPAPTIRSSALKTQAIRSGSNDPDRRVPLRLGLFAKETLGSFRFNPQSDLIQKYLRRGPVFSVLPPELL